MGILIETERLLIREIESSDAAHILRLDSNKDVHRFLYNNMVGTLEEAEKRVQYIRDQYQSNGIGRWAAVLKETGEFIGWCGMKYVNDSVANGRTNYYDIGYRLLPEYWNKGYATEASIPCLSYAFDTLNISEIHASVMHGNTGSRRVTEKIGLLFKEDFMYEDGNLWHWFSLENPNT